MDPRANDLEQETPVHPAKPPVPASGADAPSKNQRAKPPTPPPVFDKDIFRDDDSRINLEIAHGKLRAALLARHSTEDRALLGALPDLVKTLNTKINETEKLAALEEIKNKYYDNLKPSARLATVGKLILAFIIAAAVAITCALAGALIAAAFTGWTGPVALVTTFIGFAQRCCLWLGTRISQWCKRCWYWRRRWFLLCAWTSKKIDDSWETFTTDLQTAGIKAKAG